jgi:hypothetical protein
MVSGPNSSSARLAMMPCAAIPDTSRWAAQLKFATAGMVSVPMDPATRFGLYTLMSLKPWPIALEPSSSTCPAVM